MIRHKIAAVNFADLDVRAVKIAMLADHRRESITGKTSAVSLPIVLGSGMVAKSGMLCLSANAFPPANQRACCPMASISLTPTADSGGSAETSGWPQQVRDVHTAKALSAPRAPAVCLK